MDYFTNKYLKEIRFEKDSEIRRKKCIELISEIERESVTTDTPQESILLGLMYCNLFCMDIDNFEIAQKGIEYCRIAFKAGCFDNNLVHTYTFLLMMTWQKHLPKAVYASAFCYM